MFDVSDQMMKQFVANNSGRALRTKLETMADAMGDRAFSDRLAREVVARTQPHRALPEVYARYRAVVRDGIEFFLAQMGRQRLIELALSQLKLDPETSAQERLLELAKQFPTLHKLGQLIARNPHIDPAVKKWLVHLENGRYGTHAGDIMARLDGIAALGAHRSRLKVQPVIFTEASVGAVVRFQWHPLLSSREIEGVFKVLKPGVRSKLTEELVILEKTAGFFEKNRSRYSFKNFKFLEVFQEVRQMLGNEINLAAEQSFLDEAAEFFANTEEIQIPRRLPLSTDTVTAMTYLNGPKITEAALSRKQRSHLAGVLFEALVCKPLFGRQSSSLFHGDPHAGNILAVEDPETGRLRIGLVDWTLAGHLTRSDRRKTIRLMQAVVKKDISGIRRAVTALAINAAGNDPAQPQKIRALALDFIHAKAFDRLSRIQKTFKLLEELADAGFVFPVDLMLFRKAIFTLEGVICDLCPSFDMDAAVYRYLTALITTEIPDRIANWFFPLADRPENYPSLISNFELQSLLIHQYIDTVGSSYRSFFESMWQRGMRVGANVRSAQSTRS
jgi:ubiquinone biosynthesis protein